MRWSRKLKVRPNTLHLQLAVSHPLIPPPLPEKDPAKVTFGIDGHPEIKKDHLWELRERPVHVVVTGYDPETDRVAFEHYGGGKAAVGDMPKERFLKIFTPYDLQD